MMPIFSLRKIERLLRLARNEDTTTKRGRALEDLVCYLFDKVPGIAITHRDQLNTFQSEEIDVALWNDKSPNALDFLPNIVLVEAKNWSNPVGSREVSWFDSKLRNRGLDFGLLVALNGVTGDVNDRTAAHQIIAGSLREQRRIVVVTTDDISGLKQTEDLVRLIKQKLCELAVTGTLFP
jgi:hypothetical protein